MDVAVRFPGLAAWLWGEEGALQVRQAAPWLPRAGSDAGWAVGASSEYPCLRDVLVLVPLCAAAIAATRAVCERCVVRPVVRWLLAASGATKLERAQDLPFESAELERIYVASKPQVPDINQVKSLSQELKKPVQELNKWFRLRQLLDRDTVKMRVCSESMWRLAVYATSVALNGSLLYREQWGHSVDASWEDLPLQESSVAVRRFFYAFTIPMYVVFCVSQLVDSRKAKDMWEMTTHHVVVVVLVSMLYVGNFLRIGLFGILLHDVTDVFLEASKLANYFKFRGVADLLFTGFAFAWGYARLYKFMTLVVPSVLEHGRARSGNSFYAFAALLIVLCALNVYWFVKIASLWYSLFWAGASKTRKYRDTTDLSTDDEIDSDSSWFSDGSTLKQHED